MRAPSRAGNMVGRVTVKSSGRGVSDPISCLDTLSSPRSGNVWKEEELPTGAAPKAPPPSPPPPPSPAAAVPGRVRPPRPLPEKSAPVPYVSVVPFWYGGAGAVPGRMSACAAAT